MSLRTHLLAPLTLTLAACGASTGTSHELATTEQAVVRGEADEDHPAVMALDIFNLDGTETFCSAVLYAPRTLVTAAHCMQAAGGALAYHGNDFFGDFEQLFGDPGEWSNWSLSVNWELHPQWDPETLDSDLAVVYLDREQPFAPLPLAKAPLGRKQRGKAVEIVGYGTTALDDAGFPLDLLTKHRGSTVYRGFPDVHPLPEDPHPGLGDRRIRAQLMELEGEAPYASACLGDSGGPALVRTHGKQQVVGISSFGDAACADYAYYTRVSRFLPFLKRAAKRAARAE